MQEICDNCKKERYWMIRPWGTSCKGTGRFSGKRGWQWFGSENGDQERYLHCLQVQRHLSVGKKTATARRDGRMTSGNNKYACESSSSPDFVCQKSFTFLNITDHFYCQPWWSAKDWIYSPILRNFFKRM